MATTMLTEARELEWTDKAEQLWGVPLHPSGELYIYEYVIEESADIPTAHAKLASLYVQTVLNVLISAIFANNLLISIRMVISRPSLLSGWCCFIPALFGVGWTTVVMLYMFDELNCRRAIWYFIIAVALSSISNSTIILQKAYLVLLKQTWVLTLGFLLMIPQVAFMPFFLAMSWATTELDGGCAVHYSKLVPLYWFGVTIPINILFSAIVSYIAYKQYKKYGSDAWKRLTRDGIQTMCLVVLFNIICAACILFKVGNNYSDMFFVADWLTTSTILVYHCNTSRQTRKKYDPFSGSLENQSFHTYSNDKWRLII
ncbi:hypothetical protein BDF22DRAFT_702577 [Syncephalis plumigaleata]|nr:hypothetical protein BDF22DRAFT_702577 [Syncephalis plumigaleata]